MIDKIDKNKSYIIEGKDYITKITPIDYSDPNKTTNTDIFFPSTYVNFSNCENILRGHSNILTPQKITFIQIEINNTIDDILVNQIEYKAYYNQTELNLSLCYNESIKIYYSFKNTTSDKIDFINYFKEKGIDILDINDPFFNDVCTSYSESGKDLTLNDRINEIYKNYTFCEKNCDLDEIIYEDKMITCNCTIKNKLNVKDINFDLVEYNTETKNMNFKVAKCYNAFLNLKDNLFNLGFWIFLFLMILNIILLILLCCYGIKPIKNYMTKQLSKYGYIESKDEGHVFCHNYVKKLDRLIQRLNQMKSKFYKKSNPPPKPPKPPKDKNDTVSTEKSSKNQITGNNSDKKIIKYNIMDNIENLKKRMQKTKKSKFAKGVKVSLIDDSIKSKGSNTKSKIDLQTQFEQSSINYEIDKKKNIFDLNLININLKGPKKKIYIPNESEYILNIYEFEEAIKYDKRSLCSIYHIFLISKQAIMHAFFYKSPIEPFPLRLSVLKFLLGCDLALNAFFYTDDKISERHLSNKNYFVFALTNNFIAIFLSLLIGYAFMIFFANLNNITNELRQIFREEENKIKKDNKYIVPIQRKKVIILEVKRIIRKFKIKITIFYIIEFILMIFFWYYVTVFCYVYNKTQISWLINSLITILIRIIFDFILNLLLSIVYKCSIKFNSACLYRVIIFLYCFS